MLVVVDVLGWRGWPAGHLQQRVGVWLVLAKKGTTDPTRLSYDQALEEALCQGWIDGQKRTRDAGTYRQRFTPRRARSVWSQRNVGLVERLAAEGRMAPAGLAEVARAKADGRWAAAYAGAAGMEVPPDLAAALHAVPAARGVFEGLDGRNRYALLYRITTAGTPVTWARRIEQYVAMLAQGQTIHPRTPPPPST